MAKKTKKAAKKKVSKKKITKKTVKKVVAKKATKKVSSKPTSPIQEKTGKIKDDAVKGLLLRMTDLHAIVAKQNEVNGYLLENIAAHLGVKVKITEETVKVGDISKSIKTTVLNDPMSLFDGDHLTSSADAQNAAAEGETVLDALKKNDQPTPTHSKDQVKKALQKVGAEKGLPAVQELLAKYKADSVSSIDTSSYDLLVADCAKILNLEVKTETKTPESSAFSVF